mmetsp:Transcript_89718/g.274640  ORF Transcript_89718/g.274640 Transcript_89718/m.274640 type:complete len:237 (+) Transcript_89718:1054-1764(+)
MSSLPILGCAFSRLFCFKDFSAFFSRIACLIFAMPVASMNSGSLKGGFSTPRLPAMYLRLLLQCLGTLTVFRYAFKYTSRRGSAEVVSQTSTTSGRRTSVLSSATDMRAFSLLTFLDAIFRSCSSSLSSASSRRDVFGLVRFLGFSSSSFSSSSSSPESSSFANFFMSSRTLRTSFFDITFMILFCCSCSRDTFKGKSSESTTPRTKFKYRGNNSSNFSATSTRRTNNFTSDFFVQ